MKGKRFIAAEKHFEGKKKQYELEIKSLKERLMECSKQVRAQQIMIDTLSNENQQLKEWIDRLLEYTELSKNDIKEACEKDKRMGETAQMLTTIFKFGGLY